MTDETIVAMFDSSAHAEAAVRDLEATGVPSTAITQHVDQNASAGRPVMSGTAQPMAATPRREPGFWSNLFGGEPEHTHEFAVYERGLAGGGVVVTVRVPDEHVQRVMSVLERHNPVDIDERATGYAATQGSQPATGAAGLATGVAGQTAGSVGQAAGDQTLSLSEEQIAVGKRAINRGTTRIRRYVVETPVQETIALRDELVSVDRRPASDQAAANPDFTERVIEVTETTEEPVVSKSAHVREEVVVHKSVEERNETVRDTVRREDVEITKDPAAERPKV